MLEALHLLESPKTLGDISHCHRELSAVSRHVTNARRVVTNVMR